MNREKYSWIYDLLFLLVIALAAYLRLTGSNWGDGQGQHPDENTFSGVLSAIRAQKCANPTIPVDACPPDQLHWLSLSDYFNSETSPLNPYNRGYASYVYGDLPMVVLRVVADLTHQVDLRVFARQVSAFADLLAIIFLYFLVARLYDRRVALLAALFSALTVLQIQQSHFFTTDLYVNTFELLAIYFAVRIMQSRAEAPSEPLFIDEKFNSRYISAMLRNPLVWLSVGFGVAYGMALSSKINIFPLAILLPGAFILRYAIAKREETEPVEENTSTNRWATFFARLNENRYLIVIALLAGGFAAVVSFRIFQPYAFDGLKPDPRWVADIQQQRAQATGQADLPWNLQWARRTHLYSFENLTIWGLGLPLGILAWIGFLYMGWRILKGEWQHALIWSWTALYFVWQSLQFNPTMRYQLPIYPLLVMMAAWVVFQAPKIERPALRNTFSALKVVIAVVVLALTAAWAFAFQSTYLRDEPRVAASRWIFQNIPGPINVQIKMADGSTYNQPLPFGSNLLISSAMPHLLSFVPMQAGQITSISFPHVADGNTVSPSDLKVSISTEPNPNPDTLLAKGSTTVKQQPNGDPRGVPVVIKLDTPVNASKDTPLWLSLETQNGSFLLNAATFANETDFDYGIPMRVDGYDAFGGIYRGDLNLQVYWDDNADKLNRFIDTLGQTDYILIPTNHQYAQISRVPERYPLTAYYYRELMGCPADLATIPCYYNANPGDYKGRLGYDLVAVFTDYPKLGNVEINDQWAEEAFTFYDHPKVFIFKKNANFNIDEVRASLGTIDLSKAVHLLPPQFSGYSNLLLPPDRLASQRAGGTWSDLFSYDWIQNRYPYLGLLIWYIFIFILGLATYPIIRLAMPGLGDKGYPMSRALGLVIFGYFAWMAGSLGIPYTRPTIAIVFVLLLIIGAALAFYQRAELREEWRTKRKYFLMVEGLFLAFFVFDLLIRIGNPDLWHPAKGGERPMDFSYFNAILKSTSFPPYDPWFAGGYINYYYYGFVLVGTPVKLLGIVPTIAFNFILPTLFAMVGTCAFSIGWNLLDNGSLAQRERAEGEGEISSFAIQSWSFISGIAASALTILLGNLGTIQMLYNRLQQLGAAGAFDWQSTFTQRTLWAISGFRMLLAGGTLPIGPGDWYWDPSRVVPPGPDNSITEFPLFTFIYSDLHAHMMVMPIALLSLGWALSVVMGKAWAKSQAHPESDRRLMIAISILVGGLVIGATYPANLSDTYTYLAVGIVALIYSIWRYSEVQPLLKRAALTLGAVIALFLLSRYLYEPYRAWYLQAYSALDPWTGPFTPLASYFTHWGLFLFIIVAWMAWETREWMANTPLSALGKLKPYQLLIEGALVLLVVIILFIQYRGSSVGWVALPIAAWAGILLLNPKLPDSKRWVLFLIGTAMFITTIVEVVVVRGDIGRQNTIFKFYLQAWFMLAVSAGAAIAWTLPAYFKWLPGWRAVWQTGFVLLLAGAAMFTITGISGKIQDRWVDSAPHSLDAMAYMPYANYDDFGQRLDLSEDYRAIRWMQDHVKGSPVIVETNCPEYHWCTRFTIYTGLPGVVGWNFHQRQQRAYTSTWVEERVAEIGTFYTTLDADAARAFLKKYDVKYIIVGQLERAAYQQTEPGLPSGLQKFPMYDGRYWKSIYSEGSTTIYEVLP